MDVTRLLAEFRADPPRIHRGGHGASDVARDATYTSTSDCYEGLSGLVDAGSVTIETGSGLSTLVFAVRGCEHTAFFLDPGEEDVIRGWAAAHDVSLDRVNFVVGPSDSGLRSWDRPVDLFFIDGCHGYPMPQLDWFYGAGHVKRGGVLALDDRNLWAPRQLDTFLHRDPRWTRITRTPAWSAYRRNSEGSIVEEHDEQPFLPARRLPRPPRPDLNWKGRLVDHLPRQVRDRAKGALG